MNNRINLEETINELIRIGEHLIDLMRENYFKDYSDINQENPQVGIKEHYLILDKACQQSIDHPNMKMYFLRLEKEFRIEFAGIHYLKRIQATIPERWLPVFYQAPTDPLNTYKKWLQDPNSGLDHHLCLLGHRLKVKEDYIVAVDGSFFHDQKVLGLIKLMANTPGDSLQSILNSPVFSESFANVFSDHVAFNENCQQKDGIKNELSTEIQKKVFSSFLLGARVKKEVYTGGESPNLYFYNNPDLGGVAFVSINKFSSEELEQYKLLFRRLISLVGILDGFISYWISSEQEKRLYRRYRIIDTDPIIDSLKATVRKYLEGLQLPKSVLENKIYLEDDIFAPIYVVKRIGNRRCNQEGLALIVRLGIKDEDAFNFLYLENALILSKMEEFLNGWIKGYLSSGKKVSISDEQGTELPGDIRVRLDVYISPTVQDIEARKRNPYMIKIFDYAELMIEDNSNLDYWNRNILEQPNKTIPAGVYRYSELVGPGIFVGEIASAILNHYWVCSKGCKSEPLKVLDLFSGTSAAEATILKNCPGDIKIHFLGLDLNPYLLSDAFDPANVPDLLAKVKTHTHVIPVDIFDIFSHIEKDPRPLTYPPDIYSKGYDLVLSDPPHFLSLDFLYQKVSWVKQEGPEREVLKEGTLMKHLAKEAKVKCFVLYFGHKEKEWLSFFIHRLLSKEEWPDVWSILIGDERFVACFNKFSKYPGVSTDECQNDIAKNLHAIGKRYNFEGRGLKIKLYDTYYKEIISA